MTPAIVFGLVFGVLLVLIGWTFGESAAYREHRRHQDREQQDALLRSIRQDLDSLQREQQRLADKLNR
jgi:uncharacterized membrane protein YdjX (TVP38/TMEM64 family)